MRGKIQLDGAALDQWSPEALGRHIGYLPQAVELLPGTISENIARFEHEVDPERVILAAESAGVHDLIVSLPQGYQTIIGEQGTGLSAGQHNALHWREHFMVIRSLSCSMSRTRTSIQRVRRLSHRQSLGVRRRGGIAVVITHLPSALAMVNTVLVMGKGRIQAFGPKDEILPNVLRPLLAVQRPLKVVSHAMGAVS